MRKWHIWPLINKHPRKLTVEFKAKPENISLHNKQNAAWRNVVERKWFVWKIMFVWIVLIFTVCYNPTTNKYNNMYLLTIHNKWSFTTLRMASFINNSSAWLPNSAEQGQGLALLSADHKSESQWCHSVPWPEVQKSKICPALYIKEKTLVNQSDRGSAFLWVCLAVLWCNMNSSLKICQMSNWELGNTLQIKGKLSEKIFINVFCTCLYFLLYFA